MSDSTIAGLTAATTPLAGTEELPVWQGGGTKRVAVSDVGRLYTAGPGLRLDGGEFSACAPFGDPNVAVFFDDFLGTAAGVIAYNSGGGNNIAGNDAGIPGGVMALTTGGGTTGRGGFIWPNINVASNQIVYFGQGPALFEVRIPRFEALSDGTNTYSARFGFTRDPASGTPQDGLFFEYDPAARGNHNWWCVSRNNNSGRAVDSGVAASASAAQTLRVSVNAAGSEAVSSINGSIVDTNTANVPTGSTRRMGFGGAILKSAGTTGRLVYVDYVLVALHFPGGRP